LGEIKKDRKKRGKRERERGGDIDRQIEGES
jgi:hypothetical protein